MSRTARAAVSRSPAPAGEAPTTLALTGSGKSIPGTYCFFFPFGDFSRLTMRSICNTWFMSCPANMRVRCADGFFAALEVHSIIFPGLARDLIQHPHIVFA